MIYSGTMPISTTTPTQSSSTFDKLIADLEAAQQKTLSANQKRYEQMLAIYDEVIARYQPGGAFEKSALQQLGVQKTRDVGQSMQQMISSGLYGTTTAATLPQTWEATVGAPSRLKLEDIQMQRLSQAQLGKAGMIGDVTDIGPSYSDIANLALQYGQAGGGMSYAPQQPTVTRTYGQHFGEPSFGESGLLYPQSGAAGRLSGGIGGYTPSVTLPTTTTKKEAPSYPYDVRGAPFGASTSQETPYAGGGYYSSEEGSELLGGKAVYPQTYEESVSYSKWIAKKGITKTTDATILQWRSETGR